MDKSHKLRCGKWYHDEVPSHLDLAVQMLFFRLLQTAYQLVKTVQYLRQCAEADPHRSSNHVVKMWMEIVELHQSMALPLQLYTVKEKG